MRRLTRFYAGCLSVLAFTNTMAPLVTPVYATPYKPNIVNTTDKTAKGNEDSSIYVASFYFSRIVDAGKIPTLQEVSIPVDISVSESEQLKPPDIPNVEGYEFIGWDNTVPEYLSENMTFHAMYQKTTEQEVKKTPKVKETEKTSKNAKKSLTEGVPMSDDDFAAYLDTINSYDINCSESKAVDNQKKVRTVVASELFDTSPEVYSEEIINDSKAAISKSIKQGTFLPFRSYIIPYLAGHSKETDNPLVSYLWIRLFNEEKNWTGSGKWADKYGVEFTDSNGATISTKGQPVAGNTQYDKYLATAMSYTDKELSAGCTDMFNAMYTECPEVLATYLRDYKEHPEVTKAVIRYFNNSDTDIFSYPNNDVGLYLINILAHNYDQLTKEKVQYFNNKVLPVTAYAYLQGDSRVNISKGETPKVYDLIARSRFVMTPSYDKYNDLLYLDQKEENGIPAATHDKFQQEFFDYVVNNGKGLGDWIYQAWTHDYFTQSNSTESYSAKNKVKTLYKRFDSSCLSTKNTGHDLELTTVDKAFMHKLQSVNDFTNVANYSMYGGCKNTGDATKNLILTSIYYQDKTVNGRNMMDLINTNSKFKAAFDAWYKSELDCYRVNITYNLANGINSTANPKNFSLYDTFKFAPAAKKGYTFQGWFLDSAGKIPVTENSIVGWTKYEGADTVTLDALNKTKSNKVNVYAKFRANSYKVTINANGGTTSTKVSALNCDESINITPPTRTGYTFNGWEVKGAGAKIEGTKFTQGTENSTLTAKWIHTVYKVDVKLNGGISKVVSKNAYYQDKITLDTPTRKNYDFTGWTAKGTGASIKDNVLTVGTGNVTLEATWKKRPDTNLKIVKQPAEMNSLVFSYTISSPEAVTVKVDNKNVADVVLDPNKKTVTVKAKGIGRCRITLTSAESKTHAETSVYTDLEFGSAVDSNSDAYKSALTKWGKAGVSDAEWVGDDENGYLSKGTFTIRELNNCNDLSGFYYKDKDGNVPAYDDIVMDFDMTSTNIDDDGLGMMIRYNQHEGNNWSGYILYLDNHDWNHGTWDGNNNGLWRVNNQPFKIEKSQAKGGVRLVTNKEIIWHRSKWEHYRVSAIGNELKVYRWDTNESNAYSEEDGELLFSYTDNSPDAIKTGTYGFCTVSQPDAEFKNISVITPDSYGIKIKMS